MPSGITDHTGSATTIYRMALDRLPFLEDSTANVTLLSRITLEVMWELEPCFDVKTSIVDGSVNVDRVGDEENYSVSQKSIIADLVAVFCAMAKAAAFVGGDAQSPVPVLPQTTYINKVKAGTVEVSYDQFTVKDSATLSLSSDAMIGALKSAAMRKARTLGCIIDICEDCSLAVQLYTPTLKPFVIIQDCESCGC
ncbi:hypothetical protein UFOVP1492_123 [uncultured Caudovirales phage]|uniref:Uncharacterized protein n=1 Tax=uncultured Caudovirales phage TaxID=2100421 RepID=A0A6J5SR24_9CAUD|nr:hypothetical protein UFOVP1127_11 [uncultured Caudovirales phage]CAB4193344.1 hypothetical protein UFOVP1242_63 [uncultured Caudovirales phage]CAB4217903.1 hypothetical protein UFOVP1492_123 [uncultured Caudovirales phage]CAB5231061.1 hypothetical protein UFOVP1580_16 [uncultured Caudovirales phage]